MEDETAAPQPGGRFFAGLEPGRFEAALPLRAAPVFWGLALYAAAWLAARLAGWRPELLDGIGVVPADLLVLALVWRTTTDPRLAPELRKAWRLIGAAFLLSSVGDLLWAWLEARGLSPDATPVDALYLAYYPVLLLGLLSFPSTLGTPGRRLQFALDVATVVVGGGMVVWQFILGPRAADSGTDPTVTFLALAYAVGDMVLILGLAVIGLGQPEQTVRPALRLLMGGLALTLGGDLVYGLETLVGNAGRGWSAGLFMLAQLLFGASAHTQRRLVPEDSTSASSWQAVPYPSLLPYGAAAVGLATLLFAAGQHWAGELSVLLVSATVLMAIVLTRQLIAVRDNVRLRHVARRSEARFRSLIQNASDVIMVVDGDTLVRYHSPSVSRVLGYGPDELVGRRLNTLVHPDEFGVLHDVIGGPALRDPGSGRLDCRLRRRDGRWLFVEVVAADLRSDPNVDGIVLTVRDVHQRKLLEAQLTHQALHDPLTGLANRNLLTDRLEHALTRSRRVGGLLAILFLDLDDFKGVNDRLGHRTGDLILAEVASRIRGCIRAADTAARLGGDEFGVLLEDVASDAEAALIGERLVRTLRLPFPTHGEEVPLSVSIGLVTSATGRETPGELLRSADAAMYAAKREGKNRSVAFEPAMHAAVAERLELERELGDAVQKGQLVLHYQPIVELASLCVVGAEALVRWDHPSRGLLPPEQFLLLAEQTDRGPSLGRWILKEALRQAAVWPAPHGGAPPYVSVNLSPSQIQDPRLVGDLLEALASSGLDPRRLVLEIAECLVASGRPAGFERLQEPRKAGIRLAIDDFGTGYAALTYLEDLPVDLLKVDRVFVEKTVSGSAARLTRGIVELGRSLAMTMIAEGIASAEQAEALRGFGCELGQGFHFCRPLPAAEFAARLAGAGNLIGAQDPPQLA